MTSNLQYILQMILEELVGIPSVEYSVIPLIIGIIFVIVLLNDFCHMLGVLIHG